MALIVVEMGRRVVTPQSRGPRGTVKTQAAKKTTAIDQYHQFSEESFTSSAHTQSHTVKKELLESKQRHAEKNPSPVSLLAEIMSDNIITLTADASVADAWALFQQHGFHHLPIVDDNNTTLAMLADRDILQAPNQNVDIRAENIMKFASKKVFCFSPDTDIRQATRILYEYDLGALPVINNNHELLGLVSRTDIIKVVSHYGPLELWA